MKTEREKKSSSKDEDWLIILNIDFTLHITVLYT